MIQHQSVGWVAGTWRVLAAVESFNPAAGRWEGVPAMLTPRQGFVAAAIAGRIYVAGGLGAGDHPVSAAESLHPDRKAWEELPPMPLPRGRAAGACLALWAAESSPISCQGSDKQEAGTGEKNAVAANSRPLLAHMRACSNPINLASLSRNVGLWVHWRARARH